MIQIAPLTADAFAPFGDVIEARGSADMVINRGLCERFHDRARLDFGPDGRAGISLFDSLPRTLPFTLDMMERHPLGSQCFIPMSQARFLIVVAEDADGKPDAPRAFLTEKGQAVNFLRGVWHGVLSPLHPPGLFAVIDRIGEGKNLEEHWFDTPFIVSH
ncbi:MAG: ureidoglycolate lyase [Pseudomonadota bacterium]